MNDVDIRPVLRTRLSRKYGRQSDTAIINEFGIHCGIHRVDMAVVNGVLSGYEIKSEKDTLRRLPAQMLAYGMVFDRMTLVVSEKHYAATLNIIPDWWGILIATRGPRSVRLAVDRPSRLNHEIKPHALASLIWRDQALSILEERGLAKGLKSAPRAKVWDALVYHLALEELRIEVRTAIRRQRLWLQDRHHLGVEVE